jgi:hypothetical protein
MAMDNGISRDVERHHGALFEAVAAARPLVIGR